MKNEIFIADLHTHSQFSSDSKESVELMAKSAAARGISLLGISDHYDYMFAPGVSFPDNFECDIEAKEKEILRVKELYRGKITVQNGIELGLGEKSAKRCKEITQKYVFDYIIGSQHVIKNEDPYPENFWSGKDAKEQIRNYFEGILISLDAFSDFDIFAHFDYPLRYVPEIKAGTLFAEDILEDKKIKALCDEALYDIARRGKALEINTGGMRSALGRTNPSVKLLKRFFELDGKYVTFGSDAHTAKDIGYGFREFKNALESLGKKTYTVYEDRTPKEIKL